MRGGGYFWKKLLGKAQEHRVSNCICYPWKMKQPKNQENCSWVIQRIAL